MTDEKTGAQHLRKSRVHDLRGHELGRVGHPDHGEERLLEIEDTEGGMGHAVSRLTHATRVEKGPSIRGKLDLRGLAEVVRPEGLAEGRLRRRMSECRTSACDEGPVRERDHELV